MIISASPARDARATESLLLLPPPRMLPLLRLLLLPILLQALSRPLQAGKAFAPRSYWRFENSTDFTVDSMGVESLSSFEG
eukprot:SAG22_NODE_16989_length_313_cov_1.196262_1_plen_80_part_10